MDVDELGAGEAASGVLKDVGHAVSCHEGRNRGADERRGAHRLTQKVGAGNSISRRLLLRGQER
jgi:hypothetical protein